MLFMNSGIRRVNLLEMVMIAVICMSGCSISREQIYDAYYELKDLVDEGDIIGAAERFTELTDLSEAADWNLYLQKAKELAESTEGLSEAVAMIDDAFRSVGIEDFTDADKNIIEQIYEHELSHLEESGELHSKKAMEIYEKLKRLDPNNATYESAFDELSNALRMAESAIEESYHYSEGA